MVSEEVRAVLACFQCMGMTGFRGKFEQKASPSGESKLAHLSTGMRGLCLEKLTVMTSARQFCYLMFTTRRADNLPLEFRVLDRVAFTLRVERGVAENMQVVGWNKKKS